MTRVTRTTCPNMCLHITPPCTFDLSAPSVRTTRRVSPPAALDCGACHLATLWKRRKEKENGKRKTENKKEKRKNKRKKKR